MLLLALSIPFTLTFLSPISVVLNESQRVAKKSLIERNRSRKYLERVQLRIRRAMAVRESPEEEQAEMRLRSLMRKCAREYCTKIDKTLEMDAEVFESGSEEAQFKILWGQLLSRVVAFGNSFEEFAKVKVIYSNLQNKYFLSLIFLHN